MCSHQVKFVTLPKFQSFPDHRQINLTSRYMTSNRLCSDLKKLKKLILKMTYPRREGERKNELQTLWVTLQSEYMRHFARICNVVRFLVNYQNMIYHKKIGFHFLPCFVGHTLVACAMTLYSKCCFFVINRKVQGKNLK